MKRLLHFPTAVTSFLLLEFLLTGCVHEQAGRTPEITLADVQLIYTLGSMDIPDQSPMATNPAAVDLDGLQDRPRTTIWEDGVFVRLPSSHGEQLKLLRQVPELLTDTYASVAKDVWLHNYHHVAEYEEGGFVLHSGEIVGWRLKTGGLGRLEYGYNPGTEKVARFILAGEGANDSTFVYLAHRRD